MSLKHIENRRDPTIFGADLNVFLGDVTVNGDLTVLGTINGNSAQGQNGNNTWTVWNAPVMIGRTRPLVEDFEDLEDDDEW